MAAELGGKSGAEILAIMVGDHLTVNGLVGYRISRIEGNEERAAIILEPINGDSADMVIEYVRVDE